MQFLYYSWGALINYIFPKKGLVTKGQGWHCEKGAKNNSSLSYFIVPLLISFLFRLPSQPSLWFSSKPRVANCLVSIELPCCGSFCYQIEILHQYCHSAWKLKRAVILWHLYSLENSRVNWCYEMQSPISYPVSATDGIVLLYCHITSNTLVLKNGVMWGKEFSFSCLHNWKTVLLTLIWYRQSLGWGMQFPKNSC